MAEMIGQNTRHSLDSEVAQLALQQNATPAHLVMGLAGKV